MSKQSLPTPPSTSSSSATVRPLISGTDITTPTVNFGSVTPTTTPSPVNTSSSNSGALVSGNLSHVSQTITGSITPPTAAPSPSIDYSYTTSRAIFPSTVVNVSRPITFGSVTPPADAPSPAIASSPTRSRVIFPDYVFNASRSILFGSFTPQTTAPTAIASSDTTSGVTFSGNIFNASESIPFGSFTPPTAAPMAIASSATTSSQVIFSGDAFNASQSIPFGSFTTPTATFQTPPPSSQASTVSSSTGIGTLFSGIDSIATPLSGSASNATNIAATLTSSQPAANSVEIWQHTSISSIEARSSGGGPRLLPTIEQTVVIKCGYGTRERIKINNYESFNSIMEGVEMLRNSSLSNLDSEALKRFLAHIDEAAEVGFDIGWLRERVNRINMILNNGGSRVELGINECELLEGLF